MQQLLISIIIKYPKITLTLQISFYKCILFFHFVLLFGQILKGNSDENTPQTNILHLPVVAEYVMIHILEWNHHIAMRFDLQGCPFVNTTGNADICSML